MIRKHSKLSRASGNNGHAIGIDGSFQDYLSTIRQMIKKSRPDLNSERREHIIEANAPYERRPDTGPDADGKYEHGVLLIHGLFSSPFSTRDLAKYFQSKGFLVRTVLLPGHGSVPGDLLKIKYTSWQEVVTFGINSLKPIVKQIYVVGISIGGSLALEQAYHHPDLAGLILFGPALKAKHWWLRLIRWHHLLTWLGERSQWYSYRDQVSYAHYSSCTFNAGRQALLLMAKLKSLLKKPLNVPLFIGLTTDDEIISPDAVIQYFKRQSNPKNRLLIYTSSKCRTDDPRITQRNSYFPKHNILDYSHLCLPIAPNNPHFGKNGEYKDFQHYKNSQVFQNATDIKLGSINNKNLKKYIIQRLTYNPDFDFMIEQIDNWLLEVEKQNAEDKSHSISATSAQTKIQENCHSKPLDNVYK